MAAPDTFVVRGRWLFRAIVSVLVLLPCIYMTLWDADPTMKTWASGMIGIVVGYWLR